MTAILFSRPVLAQIPCAPRSEVSAVLQEQHREAVAAIGVTSNGAVLELWTSSEGDSWTVVVTLPSGSACILAAGEAWQDVLPSPRYTPIWSSPRQR
jgi:hypothetical protein